MRAGAKPAVRRVALVSSVECFVIREKAVVLRDAAQRCVGRQDSSLALESGTVTAKFVTKRQLRRPRS